MATKYSAASTTLLADEIALTDHAAARYRERTPHDCSIPPTLAFRRGEWVKHPQVAQADGHDEPPERVRVYKHGDDWGVAFLIVDGEAYRGQPWVCATVNRLDGFDHGPSRAYLWSHGPHHESEVSE